MLFLDDVAVRQRLVRLVVFRVLKKNLVHVCACVLVQFVVRAEDDERYLAIAEHAQFIGLLHHTEFAFVERNLPIPFVRDP